MAFHFTDTPPLARMIDAAAGRSKADLVLKNATFVNVYSNELQTGDIAVTNGLIVGIGSYDGVRELDLSGMIVCPGLIDAHTHLESSLLCPDELVRAILPHGTTTVVTDPHEIANVMGTSGIDYMLQATENLAVDIRFMMPSCVPATPKDESGAVLNGGNVKKYMSNPRILGLAEMMNAYGVTHSDGQVLQKLEAAWKNGKLIDGHAPRLTGMDLNAYVCSGVYSDHECTTLDEALEKLRRGQYVMIREGTAAKNLEALVPLLTPQYASRCMFCTDDIHPNDLLHKGHIDYILREAITKYGVDPILAVKCATQYPAEYFRLHDRGAIAPGKTADFAVIDSFESFRVQMVFKYGQYFRTQDAMPELPHSEVDPQLLRRARNTFRVDRLQVSDFRPYRPLGVIGIVPGQIVTTNEGMSEKADPAQDLLKIALIERHKKTGHIGLGYLKGYGLRSGAVATSISHDSHNIIVVGTNDEDMAQAANRVIECRGGIVVVDGGSIKAEVPLEIAGIMSDCPLAEMDEKLERAKAAAKALGVPADVDPFMTLSFMALSVIPTLRITTRGVIDAVTQQYI